MATSPPLQVDHPNTSRPFPSSLRQRHNTRSPMTGSATQTLTNTPDRSQSPEPLVLRLRGAHSPVSLSDSASDTVTAEGRQQRRRNVHIQWAEDVIDNEGLGRKSSKVCCIYHKPRPAGESSDESSSDSSSDSDSDSDIDAGRDGARPVGGRKVNRHNHNGDGDACGHDRAHRHGTSSKGRRRPSPNAYEKMPKYDVKPLARQPGTGS